MTTQNKWPRVAVIAALVALSATQIVGTARAYVSADAFGFVVGQASGSYRWEVGTRTAPYSRHTIDVDGTTTIIDAPPSAITYVPLTDEYRIDVNDPRCDIHLTLGRRGAGSATLVGANPGPGVWRRWSDGSLHPPEGRELIDAEPGYVGAIVGEETDRNYSGTICDRPVNALGMAFTFVLVSQPT